MSILKANKLTKSCNMIIFTRNLKLRNKNNLKDIKDKTDPYWNELQRFYAQETVTTTKRGINVLRNKKLNKGTAFTLFERQYLGIHGLLPAAFMNVDQQAYRFMNELRSFSTPMLKYETLMALSERNEKLFFKVLSNNIKELLPIVYTPTVGEACLNFGKYFKSPRGLYITINDNSISKINQILSNWPEKDIKAIVVTDGERILGLGDLGAYGMGISVGKITLYTALAGITPCQCLPVLIDVGTDNETLLEDPLYVGLRKKRIRGEEYDRLLDNFMKACVKKYGQHVLIQFEDFGNKNAYRLLDKYKKKYTVFNDDIQGTASIVLAGLLATGRITNKKLSDQKFFFFGAGGAAVGIAEMLVSHMVHEGTPFHIACDKIFMYDIDGLITKNRIPHLNRRLIHFAKNLPDSKDLYENICLIKPNVLIGAATVKGAFTPQIINKMNEINDRPIIFALSNPTSKSECTNEDAIKLTNGKVIFGSGSPYNPVLFNGKYIKTSQANNAYIFPGIALAATLFKIKHINKKHFLLAAKEVANCVSEERLESGLIYPSIEDVKEISIKIALRIGEACYKDSTACLYPEPLEKELFIRSKIYSPEYDDIIYRTYDWPKEDTLKGFKISKLTK
ncbi:NADP-dependent malic enzyme, mitochondrial [Strongyloides ratti]|uniref:Malic enzyme n=1 Tax=Strongyloides ratti TaxID=34506 RepID=A0A090L486_STRRB|nr:NADP-dependent malic enzyme, mitochondrial [Strongyloides ratti]CEF64616.1 NADP-dependent malic enzyme, mitochondrial [Strongyloides ratti]